MVADARRSPSTLARSIKAICAVCGAAVVAALMPWRASTSSVVQEGGQWRQIGQALIRSGTPDPRNPDPYQSGRVSSIAVDPRDTSRWLIGAGNGGVWETRDAGTSWTPIADDAPTLSIGA